MDGDAEYMVLMRPCDKSYKNMALEYRREIIFLLQKVALGEEIETNFSF
jgi:hypothetical protein